MKPRKRHVREPHVVRLPRETKGKFEIQQQTRVLNRYTDAPLVVRCLEPFIITAKVKGKLVSFESKFEPPKQ